MAPRALALASFSIEGAGKISLDLVATNCRDFIIWTRALTLLQDKDRLKRYGHTNNRVPPLYLHVSAIEVSLRAFACQRGLHDLAEAHA